MFRSLPAAGHPIDLRTILRSLRQKGGTDLLDGWFPGKPFFWVNSGTGALTLALMALSANSLRKRVILPAYTCPSLLAAIIKAGLQPILCDLEAHSFRMDRSLLKDLIGTDVLAVIAVHLFGIPEQIIEIKEIAGKKGVAVIEDAAQAFGNRLPANGLASSGSDLLGTFGDIGIFSFGRGKPLSFLAGGGVLVNNPYFRDLVQKQYSSLPAVKFSPSLITYLVNLMVYAFFFSPSLYWIPQGIPWLKLGETIFSLDFQMARLHPLVLSIGETLLKNFQSYQKNQRQIARAYREKLKNIRDEFYFFPEEEEENIFLLRFPVILKNRETRDKILAKLKRRGLGATGMYPVPLNEQVGIPKDLFSDNSYNPTAKSISERIITLPLHEYVNEKDIKSIAEIFSRFLIIKKCK